MGIFFNLAIRVALVTTPIILTLSSATCSHSAPCAVPRPRAPHPAPVAPVDPATIASVDAVGARLEACDRPNEYTVTRNRVRELALQEMRQLMNGLFHVLMPNAMLAGTRACGCRGTGQVTSPLCIWIDLAEGGITPTDVASHLEQVASSMGLADATARVHIIVYGTPGARCAADDPACGPVAYDPNRCAEQLGYRADRPRNPIPDHGFGACSHDGECQIGGCGNECMSTRQVSPVGTCEGHSHLLQRGLCGCVNGGCHWFVQPR